MGRDFRQQRFGDELTVQNAIAGPHVVLANPIVPVRSNSYPPYSFRLVFRTMSGSLRSGMTWLHKLENLLLNLGKLALALRMARRIHGLWD